MSSEAGAPHVPDYPLDPAPADLSDPEVRSQLSASGLRVFQSICEKWGLNETLARGLLGDVASSTFYSWKAAPEGKTLEQDTLTRISLVIGIYKALNLYFGKELADRWITLANRGTPFDGQTPIEFMIRFGVPGMVAVRRMLDGWAQGQ
jgi:hypothetical protein